LYPRIQQHATYRIPGLPFLLDSAVLGRVSELLKIPVECGGQEKKPQQEREVKIAEDQEWKLALQSMSDVAFPP
jgi:hypothetical protein